MSLRELKKLLLLEIKRIEDNSFKVVEINNLETEKTELEKDEIIASESVQRIEPEEEVKQEFEPSQVRETQLEKNESEILESIDKIELAEEGDSEIEPSVSGEVHLEKREFAVAEVDSIINSAKDVRKIFVDIVRHLHAESSFNSADLRRTGSSVKYAPNFFDRLDVNIISGESALKKYNKETVTVNFKSKFGAIKKWPVRDKTKGDILNRQSAKEKNIHSTDALYKTFIGISK